MARRRSALTAVRNLALAQESPSTCGGHGWRPTCQRAGQGQGQPGRRAKERCMGHGVHVFFLTPHQNMATRASERRSGQASLLFKRPVPASTIVLRTSDPNPDMRTVKQDIAKLTHDEAGAAQATSRGGGARRFNRTRRRPWRRRRSRSEACRRGDKRQGGSTQATQQQYNITSQPRARTRKPYQDVAWLRRPRRSPVRAALAQPSLPYEFARPQKCSACFPRLPTHRLAFIVC